ncbi:MAG: hypothetical protein ACK4WJ_01170 [Endomicrobiia bacterium]
MIKFFLTNKIIKFFYGIALLPLCYVFFQTLIFVIKNIEFSNSIVKSFFIGCGSYLVIHILLYKPLKLYVIGHELVHAISGYLCGANVKNVKVAKSYGLVNVDKINTFIALSPYFVPFYSLIIIILWVIVKYFIKLDIPIEYFMFFLGLTITFHLVLTIYAVSLGQQDLKISGWLFSIVIIFIINCLILILLFIFLFPSKIKFLDVKDHFLNYLFLSYRVCFNKTLDFTKFLIDKIKNKLAKNI